MSGPSRPEQAATRDDPVFQVNTSRGFTAWLKQSGASLAVTTYQVGKLLFFGVKPNESLWVFNRNMGRCLGLATQGADMWLAAETQILKLSNALEAGRRNPDGSDGFFVPRLSYFTGDLDVHDIAVTADGGVLFVNTLFNCLAAASASHSFVPVWKPSFISRLVAEDRCHLNGLAMRNGAAAFVTAVARSDTFDSWRDHRRDGGIVIDVESHEIVAAGLSMPHSPRWHQGRLWLHNSGSGEFGFVDLRNGRFEPLCFCPGYLRGLDFIDGFAVMGLSRPRENRTFSGLALDAQLSARRMDPRCGIYVVDLGSGAVAHSLTIEGVVAELYDVSVLPGMLQPAALGPNSPELARMISIGPARPTG
jgi:uncharacterized protein (TIGR03032 family)